MKFANFVPPSDIVGEKGDWKESYPDYLGQCNSLDENVGRLVDALKARGAWENSILFYTSDHGCHFRTRNDEYKRSCHEASIHIPLLAVGGAFQGGRSNPELVSLMDLPVTLLDCAGIKKPADFQGNSLKRLVDGTARDWRECVFVQVSESEVSRAIRTNKWKYSIAAAADGFRCSGAEVYYEQYLFDLEQDPSEMHNLVGEPSSLETRKILREKMIECMKRAGEEAPHIRVSQC